METRNPAPSTPVDLLSPLAGWEAAARWNRATFDWMAKGWQPKRPARAKARKVRTRG